VIGCDEPGEPWAARHSLYAVDVDGGGVRDLAGGAYLAIEPAGGSDLECWRDGGSGGQPVWGGDGVLALGPAPGHTTVRRVALEGGRGPVAGVEPHVYRFAAAGGRLVTLRPVGAGAPEVHVEGGRTRRLTRNGAAWQRRLDGVERDEVAIPGPAGPIR